MDQPPFDIRQSEYGRGLFATRCIEPGELVHLAPVIPLTISEKESVNKTILKEYVYEYEQGDYVLAIGLGYSSLFNHSSSPNVLFAVDYERQSIVFTAKFKIEADTELTIDYEFEPVLACRSQL